MVTDKHLEDLNLLHQLLVDTILEEEEHHKRLKIIRDLIMTMKE